MSAESRERLAVAVTVAALVAAASYAAQHGWVRTGSLTSARLVLASEHIPYFWRCAVAGAQGVVAGLLAGLLVGEPRRWLSRLPALSVGVVVLLTALLLVFP